MTSKLQKVEKIEHYYIEINGIQYGLEIDRIMYIRSSLGKITIYSNDGECISFLGRMNVVEKEIKLLDKRFIRCHRNYLVNPSYIADTFPSSVVMTDGYRVKRGHKYMPSI